MTKKVVLKEYCAEIEMLKSQLQITREKNGSVQCRTSGKYMLPLWDLCILSIILTSLIWVYHTSRFVSFQFLASYR